MKGVVTKTESTVSVISFEKHETEKAEGLRKKYLASGYTVKGFMQATDLRPGILKVEKYNESRQNVTL